MTATDELRRLLDERGVEYDKAATVIGETVATFWHDRDGCPCSAIEGADDIPDGEVSVQMCITPAQAIAATLGSCNCPDNCTNGERTETCKLTMDGTDGCFGCSECLENIPPLANFCPMCGRRIEQ